MARKAMPKGKTVKYGKLITERMDRRRQGLPPLKTEHWRPQIRGECADVPRPCPYVGCRHHLFLQVSRVGSILFPHGDDVDALDGMRVSCALDAADEGPMQVKDVASAMGFSTTWADKEIADVMRAVGQMPVVRELAE